MVRASGRLWVGIAILAVLSACSHAGSVDASGSSFAIGSRSETSFVLFGNNGGISQAEFERAQRYEQQMREAERSENDGNFTAAIGSYQRAQEFNDRSWEPIYSIGRIYFKEGSYAQALTNFESSFDLSQKKDGRIAYLGDN